jgi:hypothetical protein
MMAYEKEVTFARKSPQVCQVRTKYRFAGEYQKMFGETPSQTFNYRGPRQTRKLAQILPALGLGANSSSKMAAKHTNLVASSGLNQSSCVAR